MFNPFNEDSSATIRTFRVQSLLTKVGEKEVEDKRLRDGGRPYLVCEGGKCYRKGKRDWCLCFERIKKQRTSILLMIHGQEVKGDRSW